LAEKFIGRGKFDDFAWLIRIGVYYIVIADEQMTIGRELMLNQASPAMKGSPSCGDYIGEVRMEFYLSTYR
jgi:hypothetical protein